MKNIEFLPARYRENNAARAAVVRRWTIVLMLAVIVTPLAGYQYLSHHRAVMKFVEVDPMHGVAVAKLKKLGELQHELEIARGEAALLAYLSHPWPKTQIIAQVREPLPEAVRLTGVKLHDEPKATGNVLPPSARNRAARRSAEQSDAKLDESRPTAERDLAKLVDHLRQHDTIVTLSGVTVDNTDLHTYVAKLRISGLFSKSELKSLESMPGLESTKAQKFEIRLVLAPGHGQPIKERAAESDPQAQTASPPVELANKP